VDIKRFLERHTLTYLSLCEVEQERAVNLTSLAGRDRLRRIQAEDPILCFVDYGAAAFLVDGDEPKAFGEGERHNAVLVPAGLDHRWMPITEHLSVRVVIGGDAIRAVLAPVEPIHK
jgi:hypothetical protein